MEAGIATAIEDEESEERDRLRERPGDGEALEGRESGRGDELASADSLSASVDAAAAEEEEPAATRAPPCSSLLMRRNLSRQVVQLR